MQIEGDKPNNGYYRPKLFDYYKQQYTEKLIKLIDENRV